MTNATITRLSPYHRPWGWALRVESLDADVFSGFIDDLKSNIPTRLRKCEASEKRWLFHVDCLDALESLLNFHRVTYTIDDGANQIVMSRQQAAAELYLLPNAPAEVVSAVYKALCKVHHPDAGGDTATMQRINAAMEVLR